MPLKKTKGAFPMFSRQLTLNVTEKSLCRFHGSLGTWRLRLLLSQEKAKIRELGPDGPTPSLDDEILQPADDEIQFLV